MWKLHPIRYMETTKMNAIEFIRQKQMIKWNSTRATRRNVQTAIARVSYYLPCFVLSMWVCVCVCSSIFSHDVFQIILFDGVESHIKFVCFFSLLYFSQENITSKVFSVYGAFGGFSHFDITSLHLDLQVKGEPPLCLDCTTGFICFLRVWVLIHQPNYEILSNSTSKYLSDMNIEKLFHWFFFRLFPFWFPFLHLLPFYFLLVY